MLSVAKNEGEQKMTEQIGAQVYGTLDVRNVRVTARTATREESALMAIAHMSVNESTNHAQLSALCIAIARTALDMTCEHGLPKDAATGGHIVKVWHMGQIDMPEVDVCN